MIDELNLYVMMNEIKFTSFVKIFKSLSISIFRLNPQAKG